jgi:hypothetical protein
VPDCIFKISATVVSLFVTAWTAAKREQAGVFSMHQILRYLNLCACSYRAPELLLNEAATTAADMFSVGIMLAR